MCVNCVCVKICNFHKIENFTNLCNLGAVFFPRASFFSAFLRWHAHSLRAISFVVVVFRLAVLFHCPPRAGPARSGSATRPLLCSMLLCKLRAAGSGASAEHGGASFSSSFSRMLVVPRANRSFRVVFEVSRRRRESVRVCAVSFFFLHFPSDAISSYIHARMSFSGPRRCVCLIVSDGEA